MSRFDPISLEIMWSRLINIAEECWVTILRTAFSTIIGEVMDFGCELFDARANSIAHSPRSMPVFNLVLPRAIKEIYRLFPPDTLVDGDVLVTNDPWVGAGHLFDLAVVTPVFRRGAVVGLVGSIAHLSDIGGTKEFGRARELYEEGLQIPPLKLYHAGRLDEVLAAIIRQNVRQPEQVFGDIRAQVSSNHVGAQRLLAFMDEYGLETLEPLAEEVQARSEIAMRQAIAEIPDGTYRSVVDVHGAGQMLKMPCAVIVKGDELTVDWAGAPPEVAVGGINCTYSYTAAHTCYALKSILTPETPSNAGCFRPLHVRAPEGSVLNCRYPAAINQRTMIGWFCGPAVFRALAPALKHRVQAFTGLPASSSAYGRDRGGRTFHDHIMFAGGQGGGARTDGNTAVMYPTSAGNVAVEMYESRVPLLVERKEFIPDSAGAGAHRGGLAQRLVLRKLYDDGLPVLVNVIPHKAAGPVEGLLGGSPGLEASCEVEGETLSGGLGMSFMVQLVKPEDKITLEAAGGSGFGDPAERSEALLARDLEEGYVTASGLAAYGAEVDPDGAVVSRQVALSGHPMNELEVARRKYRPSKVRYLLVAEAPPSYESGRFFYFENVPSGDALFLEVMKALYVEARSGAKCVRATKQRYLDRFRADGFYLVDACHEPMPDGSRRTKLKCLRASIDRFLRDVSDVGHPEIKIVLISATVYEACLVPLRHAGWNVVNTEMIDFPGSGRQAAFQAKFGKVLESQGWRTAPAAAELDR